MAESHRINHSGLMRCCVETVSHIERNHPGETPDGEVVQCLNCLSKMILRDGTWEWRRDEIPH